MFHSNHIALNASDLDASMRFYGYDCGLEVSHIRGELSNRMPEMAQRAQSRAFVFW